MQLLVDVSGQKVDVAPQLAIGDISADLSSVAAQIAYWGAAAAQAQETVDKLEANYTVWKATTTEKMLQADPKLSEWKTTMLRETMPEFKEFKNAIAEAQRNSSVLWAVYNGFKAKVSALQSRGALMREELSAIGQTVKDGGLNKRQKS